MLELNPSHTVRLDLESQITGSKAQPRSSDGNTLGCCHDDNSKVLGVCMGFIGTICVCPKHGHHWFCPTAWWFKEHEFYDFPYISIYIYIGNVIIPTDELTPSFFRGVGSTTN